MSWEKLLYAGAARTLRRKIAACVEDAKSGTAVLENRVLVLTPEAEMAYQRARAFQLIADEFECLAGQKAVEAIAALDTPEQPSQEQPA